jgi:hypothetical protein
MKKVNDASPVARASVGYGVAFAWKIFNAEFSSMDEFGVSLVVVNSTS